MISHPNDLNPRQGITAETTDIPDDAQPVYIPTTSIPARGLLLGQNPTISETRKIAIPTTSIPARGLLLHTNRPDLTQQAVKSQRPQSPPGDYCPQRRHLLADRGALQSQRPQSPPGDYCLFVVGFVTRPLLCIPTTSIPARGLLHAFIEKYRSFIQGESQRPQSPPGDYCCRYTGGVSRAAIRIPTTSIPARGLLPGEAGVGRGGHPDPNDLNPRQGITANGLRALAIAAALLSQRPQSPPGDYCRPTIRDTTRCQGSAEIPTPSTPARGLLPWFSSLSPPAAPPTGIRIPTTSIPARGLLP